MVLQVRPSNVQEIRTSVFDFGTNKCYITKMASIAQQVDDRKVRNMNYAS